MTVSPARGSRDIRFTIPTEHGGGTLSCMIARGVGKDGRRYRIRRRAVSPEEGVSPRLRETSVVYADWSRGAGFGKIEDGTRGGYNIGAYLYARTPGMLMPAGLISELSLTAVIGGVARIDSAFDLGGFTYLTCGNTRIAKVTNNGTSVSVTDAGVSLGAGGAAISSAIFGDKAWVANGSAQRIVSFDGTTWTAATDDVRRARFATTTWRFGAQFATSSSTIGFSQRVLVGAATSGASIYHCVGDPGLTASWAGPNAVGDSTHPIRSLVPAGEAVFAGKTDGVYMIEGGGHMRNLAPHWRDQLDDENGRCLKFFDERLLAGHHAYLDMLSPDPERVGFQLPCHPGAGAAESSNRPNYVRMTAATTDGGFVLASFYDPATGNSFVMAGKRADRLGYADNRSPMIWYGAEALFSGPVDLLHIMPSVNGGPRWLLVGNRDLAGTAHLFVQSLPRELTPYAAWRSGGSHIFGAGFTCAMGRDDLGETGTPKQMRYVAVVTENADTARTLSVYTGTDLSAGTPIEDGTLQVVINRPGYQSAVFEGSTPPVADIEMTVVAQSGPSEPLVLRSIKMRGTINDERTVVYEVPLEIGRDVVTNRGTRDPSSPFVKRAQLYALLEAGPISVSDWNGIDRTMVVEDVADEEILDDDGAGLTIVAIVTLSVLLALPRYGATSSIFGVTRYG